MDHGSPGSAYCSYPCFFFGPTHSAPSYSEFAGPCGVTLRPCCSSSGCHPDYLVHGSAGCFPNGSNWPFFEVVSWHFLSHEPCIGNNRGPRLLCLWRLFFRSNHRRSSVFSPCSRNLRPFLFSFRFFLLK